MVVSILGEDTSSALESKFIFLNKIGKVASFLQGVMVIGGALAGVGIWRKDMHGNANLDITRRIPSLRRYSIWLQ